MAYVISDEAANRALRTYIDFGGRPIDAMRAAIAAAAPDMDERLRGEFHTGWRAGELAEQASPSGPGWQSLTDQVERLGEQLGKLQALVVEQGEAIDEEAIFEHGRQVGLSEATAGEPTDYEVWRDALKLAIASISDGTSLSPDEVLAMATWFHGRLKAGPPEPSVPDCLHCGADSSMDHFEGCPHSEPEPTQDEIDAAETDAAQDEYERAANGQS